MTVTTYSAAETRALGAALAHQLQGGDVLLLLGDLGAGKSELTRGIARGLGITDYITSPTFTILQVHEGGRLPLYHFDWYRLSCVDELYELNLDEYLHMDGVSSVEWPYRAPEAIPETHLCVEIEALDDDTRRFTFAPAGDFRDLDPIELKKEGTSNENSGD